jgi:uncharacterized membrane protein
VRTLKLATVVSVFFVVLDLVWLGMIMPDFYSEQLGSLARRINGNMAPRWGAALPIYLLIPGGILLFVRPRLRAENTALEALGWGAAFGFIVYGVYDLTNLAILEQWSWTMTLADIVWGCVICGVTSLVMWAVDSCIASKTT